MTNREAIEILQEEHNYVQEPCYVMNAIKKAIEALRHASAGEPLTIEELREMDGKPVWVDRIKSPEKSGWEIVKFFDEPRILAFTDGGYEDFAVYGEMWLAYAYPPAHIDREAWKPCNRCKACSSCAHFLSKDSYEFCKKCITGQEHMPLTKYCPSCGRPQTPEAWAEMEKRIGGAV